MPSPKRVLEIPGINHATSDWGWFLSGKSLKPIPMMQQPGPPSLMKVVQCSCTTNCRTRHCSCLKNNLKCISACGNCHGVDCDNSDLTDGGNFVADDVDDACVENPMESEQLGSEFFFDTNLYNQVVDEEVVACDE